MTVGETIAILKECTDLGAPLVSIEGDEVERIPSNIITIWK